MARTSFWILDFGFWIADLQGTHVQIRTPHPAIRNLCFAVRNAKWNEWAFALIFWASSGLVLGQELPTPLVELRFGGSLANSGALGGAAEFVVCAPHEGPEYDRGLTGLGLGLTASSRSGGTGRTPAGGAARFSGEGLRDLKQFTLCLWFKPIGANTLARLLYFGPQTDLFISNGQVHFKVISNKRDCVLQTRGEPPTAVDGAWNFVAVTLDTDTGEARLYHALADGKVRLAATAQNFSPPDATERDLEIGNLGGIRPFKGVVDNVRIFDGVLGEEEIGALFRADIPPRRTLKDYAQSAVPMSSLFRHADICFSTRWKNPKSFDVMKAFHANRVLWVYAADKNFIQQCREAGAETYQGAFNSTPRKVDESAYARNIEGQRVVAPWMVAFDRKNPVYWGCNNQPAFMEASISSAKKYVDAGADMLQFDDWQMTVSAGAWGGSCFCEKCMEGFRRYLQERLPIAKLKELGIEDIGQFNYRQYLGERFQIKDDKTYKEKKRALPTNEYFEDFQRRSVRAFFAELRKRINAEAGRVVPLSINSTLVRPGQEYNFIVDITDFFLGETWALTLPNILIGCKAAEGVGKWQVFSPIPRDVGETRLALAATYALGQLFLVPWDIYMGSDASGIKPRYFGKAEEYGDLYEFVHKNAPLFNEYETPAKVGVITNTDQYETVRTREVCQRLLEAQVPFTFVTPGHSYYDHSLDPKRLSQFDTLVRLNELEDFAPQDRATTESVADKVPVIHYSKLTDECLREMSLFEVWGPKNIYILPRTARNPEDRTLVCHVINPNQTQDLANLKWVSFLAKREALLGTKLMSARWYAPGQAERGANGDKAIDLEYEVLPEGVRVIIPKLPMWGVAVLRFE